jgi:Ferroportin1 (FPN1)
LPAFAGTDRRTALNARMRRIDLFCKLAGPLFIALIDGASTKVAIFVILGMNVLSLVVEYFAIAQVCSSYAILTGAKTHQSRCTRRYQISSAPRLSLRQLPTPR